MEIGKSKKRLICVCVCLQNHEKACICADFPACTKMEKYPHSLFKDSKYWVNIAAS